MEIEIVRSFFGGDLKKEAVRLQDELTKRFGVRPKIQAGRWGALVVKVDGEVVFSKQKEGRLPKLDELFARIEKME